MHQLCKVITTLMSKHMLSISCESPSKVAPIFATYVGKKRRFVLITRFARIMKGNNQTHEKDSGNTNSIRFFLITNRLKR